MGGQTEELLTPDAPHSAQGSWAGAHKAGGGGALSHSVPLQRRRTDSIQLTSVTSHSTPLCTLSVFYKGSLCVPGMRRG